MSVNLQYNYAGIVVDTGLCRSCVTTSYVIDNPAWIEVPIHTNDYVGKYYNAADGLWYLDASFSTIWADAPQW